MEQPTIWIIGALSDLRDYFGLKLPYGKSGHLIRKRRITEDEWNDLVWNPPPHYAEPDPEASPKPTWSELHNGSFMKQAVINGSHHRIIGQNADKISSQPVSHSISAGDLYVGSGIGHMDSLEHLLSQSARAAGGWPLSVMSQTDGHAVHFWTPSEAKEMLDTLAQQRNRAESAANIVRKKMHDIQRIANDPSGGLDPASPEQDKVNARREATEELKDLQESLSRASYSDEMHPLFTAAIAEFSSRTDDLPTEPDRARAVLKMRAAVIANERRNEVIAVAEAQDAFLPPSCLEQRDALQLVSWHRQRAVIALDRAETIPEMEAVLATLQTSLDGIRVLNTPEWQTAPGVSVQLDADGVLAVEFDPDNPPTNNVVLSLLAQAPPDIDGDAVSIEVDQPLVGEPHNTRVFFVRNFNEAGDGENRRRVSLQYVVADHPFPEQVEVRLLARNTCGPSPLKVVFRRREAPGG